MKNFLRAGMSILVVTAIAFGIAVATDEPANATPPCPPIECGDLTGWTYVSTCATFSGPGPCLGWIWEKNGNQCHVSALSGD